MEINSNANVSPHKLQNNSASLAELSNQKIKKQQSSLQDTMSTSFVYCA